MENMEQMNIRRRNIEPSPKSEWETPDLSVIDLKETESGNLDNSYEDSMNYS